MSDVRKALDALRETLGGDTNKQEERLDALEARIWALEERTKVCRHQCSTCVYFVSPKRDGVTLGRCELKQASWEMVPSDWWCSLYKEGHPIVPV